MYKVFLKYPESLRPAFPRLKEKLEDPDPGMDANFAECVLERFGLGLELCLYSFMLQASNQLL